MNLIILKKKEFIDEKFRIIVFHPDKERPYSTSIKEWDLFNLEFSSKFEIYKRYNACLQIISTIKLSNPENGKDIPVNFEIFLGNNEKFLVDNLGHWSFDLSGESEDFPKSNSLYDFNDFFKNKPENRNNINFFHTIIQFFEWQTYPYKRIKKINVGDGSLPWKKIHNAIYVYRINLESFQEDLFRDFDSIRNEVNDPVYLMDEKKRKELNEIWSETLISKIKWESLMEQINYLNREHRFIPEFFEEEATIEISSFKLYFEEGYSPLYPLIEKFYFHLTETMDKVTSWDQIWNDFMNEWEKRHPKIKDKKMQ